MSRSFIILVRCCCLFVVLSAVLSFAQGSYQAQIRGVVTDSTGAVVTNATVTITEGGTNLSSSTHTDSNGAYILRGLRPSTYTMKVESTGFQTREESSVVLAVDQQTTLNFTLRPASVSFQLQVEAAAPLLDTESAQLGTDVTNEYVKNIPLLNRSSFALVFLAGGVTETAGSGLADNYPSGTNFVSNGQRNATAEIRLDGALISAPEQGEGATSNVYYEPSVEIVQEFKVQNNSFSAEFGNNGGTVVNVALKSGTNRLHGSGWWFLQRSALDARDFFNRPPDSKPDHARDQYGFALGGPLQKNRSFFFVDFEKSRQNDPINYLATVPTLAERAGDFSGTLNPIFDPLQCAPQGAGQPCQRPQVMSDDPVPIANKIPSTEIDPVGQKIINLYPLPTSADEFNNFRKTGLAHSPGWQFDIKVDDQLSANHHLSGRYSQLYNNGTTPTLFGDGEFGPSGDGITDAPLNVRNGSLEYTWTPTPTILWTSRFGIDRAHQISTTNLPDPTSVGFPAVLDQANGTHRMPTIQMSGANNWTSLYDQCCLNTTFAHTLYTYSTALQILKGNHLFKFGGEQRLFFNNFWQPQNPTGLFNFTDDVTSEFPNSGAAGGTEGNPFASLLFGYPDNSSLMNITPAVANKSKETAFYFQDDWKVTPRLTLNLGLRYEWSSPYTERFNRLQFSDFTGDSGVNIPGLGEIRGTTIFAGPNDRSVPVDRNNFAPRLGFAYQINQDTVLRGGAGIYYGMSVATNFQLPGTAFQRSENIFFTNDNFATRNSARLSNPFPSGLQEPQGTQYGKLAEWGFINQNDLGTTVARNAEIYQWNLGVQRLLPSQIVLGVDYSASRATHLPWSGYSSTRNRNFISSALLASLVQQLNPTHDPNSTAVSAYLSNPVANPFQPLFSGSNPIFNEPQSQYNNPTLPQVNLLRPYPQFDGNFEGLPLLAASSWYHSLQVRFEKRTTHYVSFEGNYTFSKSTDDSSVGANAFVGNLNFGNPQQLDNLKAEHSISANDATHRLSAAIVVDLPIGRERWIGSGMNRVANAVVGGWSVSTLVTVQTGQPLWVYMANPRLQDGNQRANVLCSGRTGLSAHDAALNQQPFLNINCYADPGDQIPGNAPRYFSNLRSDGAHDIDLSVYKEFKPKESMTLQVRAEFFNFTNTPRFNVPDTAYDPGNSDFGMITSSAPGSNPRRMQFGVRFEF